MARCPSFLALAVILNAFLLLANKAKSEEDKKNQEIEETYRKEIIPTLQKYCYDCHDAETSKGDLNLAFFDSLESVLAHREKWDASLERLMAFEMPPKGKLELPDYERYLIIKWIQSLPKQPRDCTKIASDRTVHWFQGYVQTRRLARDEYRNTISDLVGYPLDTAQELPSESGGGEGFDTAGEVLFTSSLMLEKYIAAAEKLTNTLLVDDDSALSDQEKTARKKIVTHWPSESVTPRDAARQVLAPWLRKAFRRPVTEDEVEKYLQLFDRSLQRGDSYLAGLRLAIQASLCSPHFLFLAELEPEDKAGTVQLNPYALAAKLSYFLWSAPPDEELIALAENGQLSQDDVYLAQVRRMRKDPRHRELARRFVMQWLDLDKLTHEVRPDPQLYPEFDESLAQAMQNEVITFFYNLLCEDLPLTDLLQSDYSFVNERLAALYGVPGGQGEEFQRVVFPTPERGGLLGMAAVHASTAFPQRTSPVLRGKWLLDVLFGDPTPPAPPGVPPLNVSEHGATAKSVREQLELHRKNPDCASCHNRIDPLGFGLEGFDVIGRLRTTEVDTRGTLPNGEEFTGVAGLKKVLMDRRDNIIRHLVKKMTGYALGRAVQHFDTCIVDASMDALFKNHFRPSVLIETIATSRQFRYRYYNEKAAHDVSEKSENTPPAKVAK